MYSIDVGQANAKTRVFLLRGVGEIAHDTTSEGWVDVKVKIRLTGPDGTAGWIGPARGVFTSETSCRASIVSVEISSWVRLMWAYAGVLCGQMDSFLSPIRSAEIHEDWQW